MKDSTEETKIWDKLGLCTSILCLIHCILPPVLMLFLPINTFSFLQTEYIHDILSVVVITSIAFAVYPTCKEHGHLDIIITAVLGVIFVIGAGFTHQPKIHMALTMIGSIFLIISHVKNIKVRHGKCSDTEQCSHK